MVAWKASQPVLDAQAQVRRHFPGASVGTIGNPRHLYKNGNPKLGRNHGDHTPWGTYTWPKDPSPTPGLVYAIDVSKAAKFDPTSMLRWAVPLLRAGKYPEVKYVMTAYELYDGSRGWKKQKGDDGPDHIHVSFRSGKYGAVHSKLFSDYAASRVAHPSYPAIMSPGYGGPEATAAERLWAVRWHKQMKKYSPGYYAAIVALPAGAAEVARAEIGYMTLAQARLMAQTAIRGYAWTGAITPAMWKIYPPPPM